MVTADSVKAKIQGLITAANTKTGKSDADLTTAVNTLIDGFGQGGGGFTVTDDGAGNVTITSSAITDNNGNVVIA